MGFAYYDLQVYENNLLLCRNRYIGEFDYYLINSTTLEEISSFVLNTFLDVVFDHFLIKTNTDSFDICDINDDGELNVISSCDYPYPVDYIGHYFTIYDNRYLFCSKNYEKYIFDLQDIQNPVYVTMIQCDENHLPLWWNDISVFEHYLIVTFQDEIFLYDIENINQPVLIYEEIPEQPIFFFSYYENHFYTNPGFYFRDSIDHYRVFNEIVEFVSYTEYNNRTYDGVLFQNKIIPQQHMNTEIIDIEDDLTLSHRINLLPDYNMKRFHVTGEWAIYKNDDRFTIFSFTDIDNPDYLCDIEFESVNDFIWYYPFLDPVNPNVVYFYNQDSEKICKYFLENNEPLMLYEEYLPNSGCISVRNDIVMVSYDSDNPRVRIFE